MNEFGGYEGTANNDELLSLTLPEVAKQARDTPPDATIVVVFMPDAECRTSRTSDVIAMLERRGEVRIAAIVREDHLDPNERWVALQRYETGGGVIVMAKVRLAEGGAVGSLLN